MNYERIISIGCGLLLLCTTGAYTQAPVSTPAPPTLAAPSQLDSGESREALTSSRVSAPFRGPESWRNASSRLEPLIPGPAPRRRPVLEGAVLGFTIGFLAGGIVATLDEGGDYALLVGLTWGIPGALIGAGIGSMSSK